MNITHRVLRAVAIVGTSAAATLAVAGPVHAGIIMDGVADLPPGPTVVGPEYATDLPPGPGAVAPEYATDLPPGPNVIGPEFVTDLPPGPGVIGPEI